MTYQVETIDANEHPKTAERVKTGTGWDDPTVTVRLCDTLAEVANHAGAGIEDGAQPIARVQKITGDGSLTHLTDTEDKSLYSLMLQRGERGPTPGAPVFHDDDLDPTNTEGEA